MRNQPKFSRAPCLAHLGLSLSSKVEADLGFFHHTVVLPALASAHDFDHGRDQGHIWRAGLLSARTRRLPGPAFHALQVPDNESERRYRVHESYVERLIATDSPMTKLDAQGDPRLIRVREILARRRTR